MAIPLDGYAVHWDIDVDEVLLYGYFSSHKAHDALHYHARRAVGLDPVARVQRLEMQALHSLDPRDLDNELCKCRSTPH